MSSVGLHPWGGQVSAHGSRTLNRSKHLAMLRRPSILSLMRASYGKEPWITLGVYREYKENGGIIKDIKGLYRAGLRNFHVEQILYKQGSSPCRVLADLQHMKTAFTSHPALARGCCLSSSCASGWLVYGLGTSVTCDTDRDWEDPSRALYILVIRQACITRSHALPSLWE